jgi:hypothetical protein
MRFEMPISKVNYSYPFSLLCLDNNSHKPGAGGTWACDTHQDSPTQASPPWVQSVLSLGPNNTHTKAIPPQCANPSTELKEVAAAGRQQGKRLQSVPLLNPYLPVHPGPGFLALPQTSMVLVLPDALRLIPHGQAHTCPLPSQRIRSCPCKQGKYPLLPPFCQEVNCFLRLPHSRVGTSPPIDTLLSFFLHHSLGILS